MFELRMSWPWSPQVDAFWKGLWSSAIIFIPTVGFAYLFERLDRRDQRSQRRDDDNKVLKAAFGNVYLEVAYGYAFAMALLRMAETAKKTGAVANQVTHKASNFAWVNAQHDLTRLGMPGKARVAVANMYFGLTSAQKWSDTIAEGSWRLRSEQVVLTQQLFLPVAVETVEKCGNAIAELEAWAKQMNWNTSELTGVSEYMKSVESGAAAIGQVEPRGR